MTNEIINTNRETILGFINFIAKLALTRGNQVTIPQQYPEEGLTRY